MVNLLAYIDPGTGSFVLQAAVGAVMGVSYAARHHLRALAGKFKKRPPADKQPEPTAKPSDE